MKIQQHTDLEVYKKGFDAAMLIFWASKNFPKEETYSLTDQIRRSSRSVCANLAEAWRKRRYKAASIAKLSSEAAETQVWLQFATKCSYLQHAFVSRLRRDLADARRNDQQTSVLGYLVMSSLFPGLQVSLSPHLVVAMPPYVLVSKSPCLHREDRR